MSDLTPKISRAVKQSGFDNVRKSKISDAELKDEIIKDLTGSKSRLSSKKLIKRNVSSQLINYVDKPRFGKNTASSHTHFSEHSAKKMQEINLLHNKLHRMNSALDENQDAYL